MVTHQWFDILIILTILANCVTLAMGRNEFRLEKEKDKNGNSQESWKKLSPEFEHELNYIE